MDLTVQTHSFLLGREAADRSPLASERGLPEQPYNIDKLERISLDCGGLSCMRVSETRPIHRLVP
jgi:hypothetical protein